jgi:hypothetical protein
MSDHYYDPTTGEPRHFVSKKDGSGNRPSTIRDAKANGWYPSVTTVLKVLCKPQLERWKMIQAATAVLTSPRLEGEEIDAFMERVLFQDKEQDEEAAVAADRGVAIHDAMERYFTGQDVPAEIAPWIMPAANAVQLYGELVATEKVLVGDGYAGKTDLILRHDNLDQYWVIDWKSSKKLPKSGAYFESRLQCAAYAKAFNRTLSQSGENRQVRTMNVYISTETAGQFVIFEHEQNWELLSEAFDCLVRFWQIANGYIPNEMLG